VPNKNRIITCKAQSWKAPSDASVRHPHSTSSLNICWLRSLGSREKSEYVFMSCNHPHQFSQEQAHSFRNWKSNKGNKTPCRLWPHTAPQATGTGLGLGPVFSAAHQQSCCGAACTAATWSCRSWRTSHCRDHPLGPTGPSSSNRHYPWCHRFRRALNLNQSITPGLGGSGKKHNNMSCDWWLSDFFLWSYHPLPAWLWPGTDFTFFSPSCRHHKKIARFFRFCFLLTAANKLARHS
jgi:hypothetical protein